MNDTSRLLANLCERDRLVLLMGIDDRVSRFHSMALEVAREELHDWYQHHFLELITTTEELKTFHSQENYQ